MEITESEVLRYLGYRGSEADGRVLALTKELSAVFAEKAVPKNVYGKWDCRVDSPTVALDGMTVTSENLAKHLAGCRCVLLMAATLGPEADRLIRRYSVLNMEKAVISQAVCAAMIEAYCDMIESEIAEKYEAVGFNRSGLYRTTRFSPGYGDFDITHQKDIVNLLNCDRRIGLTLTNGYMLIPSKSVTAVIGFAENRKETGDKCDAPAGCAVPAGCARCALKHCGSRRA